MFKNLYLYFVKYSQFLYKINLHLTLGTKSYSYYYNTIKTPEK